MDHSSQLGYDGQAEVIEDTFFEHLAWFTPSQTFLLNYLVQNVRTCVVWIEDQEFAFSQLPRIVETNDAVSILSSSIHHWTSHLLKVLSQNLALLNYILSVWNVQYSTVIVGYLLDYPRDLSRSDPLIRIFEFIGTSNVDSINYLLEFSYGWHFG